MLGSSTSAGAVHTLINANSSDKSDAVFQGAQGPPGGIGGMGAVGEKVSGTLYGSRHSSLACCCLSGLSIGVSLG